MTTMHLFFILRSMLSFRRKLLDLLLRKACPQNNLLIKLRLRHCFENRQSLLLSAFQTALFYLERCSDKDSVWDEFADLGNDRRKEVPTFAERVG